MLKENQKSSEIVLGTTEKWTDIFFRVGIEFSNFDKSISEKSVNFVESRAGKIGKYSKYGKYGYGYSLYRAYTYGYGKYAPYKYGTYGSYEPRN